MFYNIAIGGDGGNTIIGYSLEQKKKLREIKSEAAKGIINLGEKNGQAKKVICLNTGEIFNTIKEAADKYGVFPEQIGNCCSRIGNAKTAGFDKVTNERLQWDYYEENREYVYKPFKSKRERMVKCLTTGEVFSKITDAANKYNICGSNISYCCNGKIKYAGKLNGVPMRWIYI